MFKIGDEVLIKDYDFCCEYFKDFVSDDMGKYCSKKGVIFNIRSADLNYYTTDRRYYVKFGDDKLGYSWDIICLIKKHATTTMEIE